MPTTLIPTTLMHTLFHPRAPYIRIQFRNRFFILDCRRGIIRARRTPHLTFKLLLGRT